AVRLPAPTPRGRPRTRIPRWGRARTRTTRRLFRHARPSAGTALRLRQRRSGGKCVGEGWTRASPVSANQLEAAPTASIVAACARCRFGTTVPWGRLVGLVGVAPSARLDEARIHLNYWSLTVARVREQANTQAVACPPV